MSTTVQTATDIRPFHTEIPEEQIDELRRRIAATRWPSKELVDDRSQGVQLGALRELARYWAEDYDFARIEARLNALPQFTTEIDGVMATSANPSTLSGEPNSGDGSPLAIASVHWLP